MAVLAVTFFVLLIPFIAILATTYFRTKKIYPLLYELAAFTYVNTVAYSVDVFDPGKNGVMLILFVSALIMVAIGKYTSKLTEKYG